MNFAEQIARIQSAASDPRKLALAVLDIVLVSHPPELRRVLQAAAVLRWFDELALKAVLDVDLADRVTRWLTLLKSLSAVEPASGRDGWNVHETTRLALREQLWNSEPERMTELARRACAFFQGPDVTSRIEHAYHLVLVDPAGCGFALRSLNFDLQANPETALAFAAALGEYMAYEGWPEVVRGWAAYFASVNRAHFRSIEATIRDAEMAFACFEACGLMEGSACAQIQLGDALVRRGKVGDMGAALGHYERSLEVRQGLLGANPGSAVAARDLTVSLDRLGDILVRQGQPGDMESALEHYERSLAIRGELLRANPGSALAARDMSVSLDRMGDILVRRGQTGDLELALGYYERSHAVREELMRANPGSALAVRDVTVSLDRMGDILVRRGQAGDLNAALRHYEQSLEVSEGLLRVNAGSAEAARDVSVSLERLGDILTRRGHPADLEAALAHFERSVEVREGLLRGNPGSALAARDVSVSLNKLGSILVRRGQSGDLELALGHCERSLEVSEGLLRANPGSAEAARDVTVSLDRLGDILMRRGKAGDLESALGHYERSFEVREGLLRANPGSALAARDVTVSLERLADFLVRRGQAGDIGSALGHYERSLEIRDGLLRANPGSAQAARDVLIVLEQMAALEGTRAGGETRALEMQMRALEIALKLSLQNPNAWEYQRTAAASLFQTFHRAEATGNMELAQRSRADCFSILNPLVKAGVELDPAMRELHAQLVPMFPPPQAP